MLNQVIAIPGRPGFKALLWWFQGPSSDETSYRFEINGVPPQNPPRIINVGAALAISAGDAGTVAMRTFLAITRHDDGPSGDTHRFRVIYRSEASNTAYSRTLPDSPDGLNVVLASCFYHENNRFLASAPLPHSYMNIDQTPHVKMLCGDQIYLDLKYKGYIPSSLGKPWKPYEQQWYEPRFLSWMSRGGNLCLADDHEFWNNFPNSQRAGILSGIWGRPTSEIEQEMAQAFQIYQAVLNADPDALSDGSQLLPDELHCFEFPGASAPQHFIQSFSMLVLDTRTQRSVPPPMGSIDGQFCNPVWLNKTIQSISQRKGPTLLVTSQSLLDKPGDSDSTLANYPKQFRSLWQAIWNRQHSVLLLTGDIHWSRAQQFETGTSTKIRHYEIVSSALSRIGWGTTKQAGLTSEVKDYALSALRFAETYASNNYAILQFSSHDLGLRCTVRWWQLDGNGKHVQIDTAESLRSNWARSSFAKDQMSITLELG
ncbi:hypothetical protein HP532_08715 [Pseudomonas sp. CrR25]|nr:hypothetical protein [Pseudomonas sp. CrR25]